MERLSSLWQELQNNDKLPGNKLTTSCQEELLELMRQLDIMLTSKKRDWEQQTSAIKSQLDMRDKELTLRTSTIDHKTRQIDELTSQLRSTSLSRDNVIQQYASQLLGLNNEVKKMKREYEKLDKKYNRQTEETERHKSNSLIEIADGKSNVQRLKSKLEETQQKLKDSEHSRKGLKKQIDAFAAEKKVLSEKCVFIEQQSETYQSQIERRRQLQDNTEYTLKTTVAQLEEQIERHHDKMKSQDSKIKKLKSSLNEAMNAHKRAMNDNEKLLEDLKKTNISVKSLDTHRQQLEVELHAREDLLRAAKEDSLHYSQNMSILEQSLSAKDDIIRNLGDSSSKDESERVDRVQEALKDECRFRKKMEVKLRDEVSVLESRLEMAKSVQQQLESKESQLHHLKTTEMKTLQHQIQQLENKLSIVERSHDGELDGMKVKLTQLTSDLHDRHTSIAMLSDKTSRMEQQLQSQREILGGREAELKVALAESEAMRADNVHLRQDFMEKLRSSCARMSTDHVSNESSAIVFRLENENENLRSHISQLKHEMTRKDDQLLRNLRDSHTSSSAFPGRTDQQSVTNSIRINNVNGNQTELRGFQTQMYRLDDELEQERLQNRRMTESPMTDFNGSTGTIVDSEMMSLIHSPLELDSSLISMDIGMESSADAAAELFLSQEQERARDLERIIDSHIEFLRAGTQQTMKRYTPKR